MEEPAKRPVSFLGGCLVGCAAAACGVTVWIVVFLASPDDDGYPLAVWMGISVGVAVLVALAWRRPTRLASLGMLVGATAMILATVAMKILVYDYP